MPTRYFPLGPRRCSRSALALGAMALLLNIALLAPLAAQRPDPPPYYAIQNARIVPVAGPVIEKGTIVIANGLIQAVGKNVKVPPEAWVIDGEGLTVYPGLIDALSTVGLQAAEGEPGDRGPGRGGARPTTPQRVARGPEDRTATTPWELAADKLDASDAKIKTWRKGGFTTVIASPSNGIFPGQAAVINLAGREPKDMVVKTPAALRITLDRARGGQYPGSLFGVIAYIRQLFLDAGQYQKAWEMYEANPNGLERPGYDRALAPLVATKAHARLVLLPGNLARQIDRAVNLGTELGLRTVVYGGQEGYRGVNYLKGKKIPVLVNVDWPKKDKKNDPEAEESLRTLRYRDRAPSSPAEFQKAGIPFAFYSGGVTSPKAFLKNVKRSIDAGLTPEAALRALTLSAAEIFDVGDRLGSLEAGKMANLTVTDGDLFDEKTKIKMVFVDGEKFENREPDRPKEKPETDLTGTWTLEVSSPRGPEERTAYLTMAEDGTLTGEVTTSRGTFDISEGWVSGKKFSFTLNISMRGRSFEVTYSGEVKEDSLEGTLSAGPQSMDFTGKRADPDGSTRARAKD